MSFISLQYLSRGLKLAYETGKPKIQRKFQLFLSIKQVSQGIVSQRQESYLTGFLSLRRAKSYSSLQIFLHSLNSSGYLQDSTSQYSLATPLAPKKNLNPLFSVRYILSQMLCAEVNTRSLEMRIPLPAPDDLFLLRKVRAPIDRWILLLRTYSPYILKSSQSKINLQSEQFPSPSICIIYQRLNIKRRSQINSPYFNDKHFRFQSQSNQIKSHLILIDQYNIVAKMHPRLCEKAGKHSGRQIQAFCLEDSCRKNRLLCFFCVFESHFNHKIAYLHRELGGAISNLDQQIHVTSKEHRTSQDKMEETFTKITKACERLGRASTTKVTIIKNLLNPQIQAIRKSFKKNSVDEILKDLTSNHYISNEKLERYAKILQFYDKNELNDMVKLEKNSELIFESFRQLVNDAEKKIEAIFNILLVEVEKFDIGKDLSGFIENIQAEKHAELSDKRIQDIQQEKQERNNQLPQNHQNTLMFQEKDNMNEEIQVQYAVNQQEGKMEMENESNIDRILTPMKKLVPENNEHPLKDFSSDEMIEEKMSESSHVLRQVGNGYLMTGRQKEMAGSDVFSSNSLWSPPKRLESIPTFKIERTSRNTPQQGPHIENVHIYSATTTDLNKMLGKINYINIKSLVIKCDTRLNIIDELSVELISKMENLISLKIYLAKELSEALAIEMLKPLDKLQELVLAEFSDLTPRLIEVMKKYNPNLNRICFTFDMGRLKDAEEMLEFLPDIAEGYREEKHWQALTNSSLMLQNIELQNIRNIQYWISYVKGAASHLKEVTIIDSTIKKVDYTQLFNALAKCKSLEYLRLQLLEFDEDALIDIITNNPNLKNFILSECNCITQKMYKSLSKYCPNLKVFSLSLEDVFTGKYSITTKNMESLVLRACYGVNEYNLSPCFRNWKKLKCLTIDYASCWLTHSTLKEIDRLTHLQVLNISNTKLKAFGHHLESLKKLETFICANSDISYEQVGTFAFARKLLKLSISGTIEDGKLENIDLGKLASLFPKLTHLKLVNFRNIVGDARMLNHMSGLVSLIVGKMKREDVETFGHYCRGRDINFLVLEES